MKLKFIHLFLFPLLLLTLVQPVFGAAPPPTIVNDLITKGPWLDARIYKTLASADAAAVSAGKQLVISTVWATVPATLSAPSVKILPGGKLDGSGTVAISGAFEGADGCFGVSQSVTELKEPRPEYWGGNTIPGTTDMTLPITKAVACAIATFNQTYLGADPVTNSNDSNAVSPVINVKFRNSIYKVSGSGGISVVVSGTNRTEINFIGDGSATIVGTGSNKGFVFTSNSGFRNKFKGIRLTNFTTAIEWSTNDKPNSELLIDECQSSANDIFVDTVSYALSRSSTVHIKNSRITNTRVAIKSYVDMLWLTNLDVLSKASSTDALFYLSGDGNVKMDSCMLIPLSSTLGASRWIDFVSDPAQSTAGDRTTHILTVTNTRASLETSRGFLWTYDLNAKGSGEMYGNNRATSISIENSHIGSPGSYPVVNLMQGYPGSITLKNVGSSVSTYLVALDAGNTTPPTPSIPGFITNFVISVDEATRLQQNVSYAKLVDPALEPFYYDSTSQTSKYKRSIPANIDYRLPTVAAATNYVKTTIPIYFDSANTEPNRDILTFLVTTVSDAFGPANGDMAFRATATALVTIVGGSDGGSVKRIITTVLQDAEGGTAALTNKTAVPTVFWGTGDTGSATISSTSTSGTEDHITITWLSQWPESSWAYIVPLAGIRENQTGLKQFGAW